MKTYSIKTAFQIDQSICPPFIVGQVFPNIIPEKVEMDSINLIVTVQDGVTPLDLGPLVKVEEVVYQNTENKEEQV